MNDKNIIPQADVSNFLEGNASRYRIKIYIFISSRGFFKNQPNEICRHWGDKASKGRFFKPDKLQIHSNAGKGKEKKKERGGRKVVCYTAVFSVVTQCSSPLTLWGGALRD